MASVFSLALSSCKKEVNEIATVNGTKSPTSKDLIPCNGIEKENGILYFATPDDLRTTLSALANNHELAIEDYQSNLSESLDPEEFDVKANNDGWDVNQTFIDFENEYNFSSLRPIYEAKITQWGLDGLIPEDQNNPDFCLPTDNLPLLTILNQDAVFGCDGKLYKLMNNGVIYVITDGDLATIDLITPNYQDKEFKAQNIEIINPELIGTTRVKATCYRHANNYKNYNWRPGQEHVQDKIQLFNGGIFSFCEAKMINWKHKGGNSYVRQTRKMRTGVKNTGASALCGGNFVLTFQNNYRIVSTRTYVDVTVNAESFQASEGNLFTNSDLEYYGSYYNWNTLLR